MMEKTKRDAALTRQILAAIASGAGQGHGDRYRPWLRIRRRNPSPCSSQIAGRLPGYQRTIHCLSRLEWHIALLLCWIGVRDIREQYPLWPIAHPHPLTGAEGAEDLELPRSRGLLRIAQDAGIDHGNFVGSHVPYVATLDFMVTVGAGHGSRGHAAGLA